MEIAEFLLARIAEDESAARECAGLGRWEARRWREDWAVVDDASSLIVAETKDPAWARHIARQSRARVLAECEAKRRIVAEFRDELEHSRDARVVLRLLALPYTDHEDYRSEWKP